MRRKLLAAVGVAVAALATATITVQAQADPSSEPAPTPAPTVALPEPTGDTPVGRTTLHLVDHGRPDPWVPEEDRELMVSMWYPAKRAADTAAQYMTPEESTKFIAQIGAEVPPEALSTVTTTATEDATPVGGRGKSPLVVLSPGFSFPRATLTGLAEELASHGYVVAGIGHNYEAAGTTFPDGHTTDCVACATDDLDKVTRGRAADTSFVLDALTGKHPAWKGAKLIDADHIAMAGHSIGGASAIPALLSDDRIDAGANMDGKFFSPHSNWPDKPFLMMGQPKHEPAGSDETWDTAWQGLTGWKRWLTVDGTTHSSFTDLASLGDQLGLPLQDLTGDRCVTLTRAYLLAFVDTHLRGEESPVLDGPTDDHPEVQFHNP
jgi:predicted dienelactone hydrolase